MTFTKEKLEKLGSEIPIFPDPIRSIMHYYKEFQACQTMIESDYLSEHQWMLFEGIIKTSAALAIMTAATFDSVFIHLNKLALDIKHYANQGR